MGTWIESYSEQRQRDIHRLAELRQRYEDLPFGLRHQADIDGEMRFLQERIASDRPMYETADGLLIPRPTGLRKDTLAMRMADGEPFRRPLRARAEGRDINPETDLVPEVYYPEQVRIGGDGASLTDGQKWFESQYKDQHPVPTGKPMSVRRLPKSVWADLISSQYAPDSRQYYGIVQDQNGRGSCAAEGGGGANHNKCRSFDYQPQGAAFDIAPNPWFIYHTTSGGYDGGSTLEDTVAFLQRYGCATNKIWPRSHDFTTTPSEAAYEDGARFKATQVLAFPVTDTELLGTMILYGCPVYTGSSGHAWYMIWLLSTTQGIWMNSWSSSWGDNGMGTISFSSLRYACYAWLNTSNAQTFSYN